MRISVAARRTLACALTAASMLAAQTGSATAAVLDLETLDGPTAIEMMADGNAHVRRSSRARTSTGSRR